MIGFMFPNLDLENRFIGSGLYQACEKKPEGYTDPTSKIHKKEELERAARLLALLPSEIKKEVMKRKRFVWQKEKYGGQSLGLAYVLAS